LRNINFTTTILFFLAYLGCAEAGHTLSFSSAFATFWPPSGLAIVILALKPWRDWPLLLVAMVAANITSDMIHEKTLAVSLGFCCANLLEAITGAAILRVFAPAPFRLDHWRQALLMVAPAVISTGVGGLIGAAVVCNAFNASYAATFPMWWVSDAVGVLVIGPIVLSIVSREEHLVRRTSVTQWTWFAVAMGLLCGISLYVFRFEERAMVWTTIPPLLWLAFQFEVTGVSLGVVALSLVSVICTKAGFGPFANSEAIYDRVVVSQTYLGTLSVVFLMVATTVRQRRLESQKVVESAAELRQTIELLKRSNADLEQFSFIASHDLRSPLRAVSNLARWVIEDCGDQLPESSAKNLGKLEARTQRMQRLLDGLLEYSRISSYQGVAEPIDVPQLIEEHLEKNPPPNGFEVKVEVANLSLQTDKELLGACLSHLIENGVKHHDKQQGQVTVTASEAGQFVEFVVEDDGPGVQPEFHAKIFEILQTLKPRDEVEASGLGLAIVRRVAEHCGGRVSIDQSNSRGARFRLQWPKSIKF